MLTKDDSGDFLKEKFWTGGKKDLDYSCDLNAEEIDRIKSPFIKLLNKSLNLVNFSFSVGIYLYSVCVCVCVEQHLIIRISQPCSSSKMQK